MIDSTKLTAKELRKLLAKKEKEEFVRDMPLHATPGFERLWKRYLELGLESPQKEKVSDELKKLFVFYPDGGIECTATKIIFYPSKVTECPKFASTVYSSLFDRWYYFDPALIKKPHIVFLPWCKRKPEETDLDILLRSVPDSKTGGDKKIAIWIFSYLLEWDKGMQMRRVG